MPLTEMTVMVAIIAALILGFIQVLRLAASAMLHRTIRKAVEKEPASAEPLLARLAAPRSTPDDDRLAIILVALGLAMVAASAVIGDEGIMRVGIAAAMFPLFVGGALWLRFRTAEQARRRGEQQ